MVSKRNKQSSDSIQFNPMIGRTKNYTEEKESLIHAPLPLSKRRTVGQPILRRIPHISDEAPGSAFAVCFVVKLRCGTLGEGESQSSSFCKAHVLS